MRADVLVDEVLAKCDAMKRSHLWPSEPGLRPRAWLNNFDPSDQGVAAYLLSHFTYYNAALTDALLVASYESLGDGLAKGPAAPEARTLLTAIKDAAFTPVQGEDPKPTDSGNFVSRRTRQLLGVPDDDILEFDLALDEAYRGRPVTFVDDFVGSGDQFIKTWTRDHNGRSFRDASTRSGFVAIYITLVSTEKGLDRIHGDAPSVAVCATHVLGARQTVQYLCACSSTYAPQIEPLLRKYHPRLAPLEPHIASSEASRMFGYKQCGLLFGFEHSMPDATLPLFWAPGSAGWEPLRERR